MNRVLSILVTAILICACPIVQAQVPDSETCGGPSVSFGSSGLEPASISETVEVLDDLVIADLQISTDFSHGFIGDLIVTATSPAATSITLHSSLGGAEIGLIVTWWDFGVDHASASFQCDCLMKPFDTLAALQDYAGESSLGIWTLDATDTFPSSGGGPLDLWCVRVFLTAPTFPVTDVSCAEGASSTVEVTWTNGDDYDDVNVFVNGLLETTLAGPFTTGVVESYTTLPFVPPTTAVVCIEGVKGGGEAPQVCCSQFLAVPADLQVCETVDFVVPASGVVETDTLAVVDAISIDEVEVAVLLTTTFLGDFAFSIVSPAGTSVQLHSNGGGFLGGALMTLNVLYDDDGVANTGIGYDCACAMQPSGPGALADFETEISAGDWTMELTTFTEGTLEEWCLRFFGCALLPPSAVSCGSSGSDVDLAWTNAEIYDSIDVERDGAIVATLSGTATSFTDIGLATGRYVYRVAGQSIALGCGSRSAPCRAAVGFIEVCDQDLTLVAGSPGDTLTITVTDSIVLETVEVLLDAAVTFTSDWDFLIESPYGTTVQLHNNGGGAGSFQLAWSDAGGPNTGVPGSYNCDFCSIVPSGPGALADFEGELSDGEWILSTGVFSADGSVAEWCVGIFEGCTVYPPTDLVCVSGDDVPLSWTNNGIYDTLDVLRDGGVVAKLDGDDTSYTDVAPPAGFHIYRISAATSAAACSSPSPPCFAASGFFFVCSEDIDIVAGTPGGSDTVTFVEPIIAGDVEVLLEATVGFVGDWDFFLVSPFGTEVQLHNNGGLDGIAFDLVWSDAGAANTGELGLYDCDLCKIQPSGPGAMADFFGEIADGEWSLTTGGFSPAGVIDRWCLAVYEGCELSPPSEFACVGDGNDVDFSWSNSDTYSSIEITRNGITIASGLPEGTTSFTDANVPGGIYTYRVFGVSTALGCSSGSPLCILEHLRTETCNATPVVLLVGIATESIVTIADATPILEVEVSVDVTEGFGIGDLNPVVVESPASTSVTLFDASFGAGVDMNVTFSSIGEAADFSTSLDCGGCRILPSGPGTLSDFENESADGDWTLAITTAFGPATLNEWCVGIFEGCGAAPPTGLTASEGDGAIDLEWTNGQVYASISVTRNDVVIATLAGASTSYSDTSVTPGRHSYRVLGFDSVLDCFGRAAPVDIPFGRIDICEAPGLVLLGTFAVETDELDVDTKEDVEIADTEIFIDLAATFQGNYINLSVVSPTGTSVQLHPGTGGGTNFNLTYSDHGVANTFSTVLDCGGCLVSPNPGQLSDFTGELADGTWTLEITTFEFGPLNEWCVDIYPIGGSAPPVGPSFLRGDASGNGIFNALLDALFILNYQFNAGPAPPCFRSADSDGNSILNALLDALYILNFQFNAGPAPPAPGPTTCGLDPDGVSELLSCVTPDPICN